MRIRKAPVMATLTHQVPTEWTRRLQVLTWGLLLGATRPGRWDPAVAALRADLDAR